MGCLCSANEAGGKEANPPFLCLLFYSGPHQIVFSLFSGNTSVGLDSLTGEVTQFFMSEVVGHLELLLGLG